MHSRTIAQPLHVSSTYSNLLPNSIRSTHQNDSLKRLSKTTLKNLPLKQPANNSLKLVGTHRKSPQANYAAYSAARAGYAAVAAANYASVTG